ncbi:hypothetical protein [Burkholderia metallica]|uniref:hypothetical protein n=1 Tax=Burkholderia metallica TaxID=488729 RepID=UPI00131A7EFD|nr:hypothetical protein [Burkholderia metallica]
MSDAAANARAFSGRDIASEKDQPMIESGAGAVYEAIVRRKSRAAIWRAAAKDRGARPAPGRQAGRNLGLGAGQIPKSRPSGGPKLS